MQLIYRGVRYEVQSSEPKYANEKLRMSSVKDEAWISSPTTVRLKYRGLNYTSNVQQSAASISDPDLESFIAAFWAIVDA